jgi:hypothetical protein
MTEAEKPRSLEEHTARAVEIYNKLCEFARDTAALDSIEARRDRPAMLAKLREGALAGYWLYPLIEAKHGPPR